MTKLTYSQQLAHPKWQRRRLEMLSAASWACSICDSAESQLHVHHRAYFKGRMAWEYDDHELAVLCNECHGAEHYDDELLKRLLSLVPLGQSPTFNALALLAGYFGHDVDAVSQLADDIGVYARIRMIGLIAARLRHIPEERLAEALELVNAMIGVGDA